MEIMCLTRDEAVAKRLVNFKNLHGIHISYLNNIVQKFRDEMIDDLFDFFAEPWAFALLDNKFKVSLLVVVVVVVVVGVVVVVVFIYSEVTMWNKRQ